MIRTALRRSLLAASLLVFAVPGSSAAAAPEHSRSVFEFPDGVFTSCGTFDVLATDASRERLSHTWRDATGSIVLRRDVVHFDFTLTNSVTGTSGAYTGQFVVEINVAENTFELRGAYRKLQIDGRNVLRASGYTMFDDDLLPDDPTVFIHGKSGIDEWEAQLCSAMDR